MVPHGNVYQKTPEDKVVILDQRAYLMIPFLPGNWLDMRVGVFLSLTQAAADDVTTGLEETVPVSVRSAIDRYWIGVKTRGPLMPEDNRVTFVGFTNRWPGAGGDLLGDSLLSSSDQGLGTSNANFWRPNSSASPSYAFLMLDGQVPRGASGQPALAQHFPQNPAGAGGYAVLLAIRLTRSTPTSRTITAHVKRSTDSADMLYSNTPSKKLIEDTIRSWPASSLIGPAQLAQVPNAIYCYWPFLNSRLRVHSHGVLQAA